MKRTNIAMKCNMAYDNCIMYLDWMRLMDLIKLETNENGHEVVSLAEKGESLFHIIFKTK